MAGVLDPTPLIPAPVPPGPVGRPAAPGREFGDPASVRRLVYDNVLAEARKLQPVQNKVHALSVADVDYEDPDDFPLKRQKKAILEGETLARRLRGTLRLTDLATGQTLDERRVTLAAVPHVTDRGTYILNGTEYTLANQMRLRPGVFSRVKENGEIEAHVNVLPGKGPSSRILFDPASNVFRLQLGQAKLPLLPVLKALGVDEKRLREAWGNEIFAANAKHDDTRAVDRLYEKLSPRGEPGEDRRAALKAAFARMELDPEVTGRTLGTPFRDAGGDTLLAAASRLVALNKGEAEPDDRDHMAYQTVLGPEDLFAERVRAAARVLRPVLWKATMRRNLGAVLPGLLTRQVTSAITGSGLGQPLEEVNPADIYDQLTRVSRMGEGGIPSSDSVPMESRSVQPSHFGFVDPIRTPESQSVGVDVRLAGATRKGADGRVYTKFKNVRTGEAEWKAPQELADAVIAFPGEMDAVVDRVRTLRGNERELAPGGLGDPRYAKAVGLGRAEAGVPKKFVAALVRGKIQYVPREKVDFELPRMEHAFNPLANLIPLKSTVKGQRVGMGSRMLTQALPLVAAEAPLVQAGVPDEDERSYEEVYGRHMGAVSADGDGEVLAAGPDEIKVRYADGSVKTHELYNSFPLNRKTFYHNTPVVRPGDRVKAGALLARSNYTDAAGVTALGTNLRTAYLPYRGYNFEDAVVISRSAAEKKLASEHMYQHDAEWGDKVRRGRNTFASLFPSKFDRKTLDTIDDDGVVKPGTVVRHGHPLVLMARERDRAHNQLSRGKDASFTDDTLTWDHHSDGVVTDVAKTKKGAVVTVKAVSPMEVGDKLSGRYGDKGVIAEIVDDEDMPHGPDGKPYEVLVNPLGVITRTNPGQMVEAALGKIAVLTGKPYKVKDFAGVKDMTEYAMAELAKHGLSDLEDLVDPQTGRKIPGVFTGNRFFMKLHHSAESKGQGRGTGGYTNEEAPAKGGATGCFVPKQRIRTLDGDVPIARICEKRLGLNVLCWSPRQGEWVYRPVTDWFVYRAKVADIVSIETSDGTVMSCTKNHMVYVSSARKVAAGDLSEGDSLVTWGPMPTAHQEEFMLGSLLGDASVTDAGWTCEHSVKQAKYLAWKQSVLSGLGASTFDRKPRKTPSTCRGKPVRSSPSRIVRMGHRHVYEPLRTLCYPGGVKTVSREWLSRLSGLGVAVWLLDDGSITNRAKKAGRVHYSGNIATMGFDAQQRQMLADWLAERYGCGCTVNAVGALSLSAELCVKLIDEVARWVPWDAIPKSKKFLAARVRAIQAGGKTLPLYINRICRLAAVPIRIKSVRPYRHDKPGVAEINVYDFTVFECHNYVAGSALVSNSKRVSMMDVNALLSHGALEVIRDASAVRGQKNLDWWAAYMQGHTPPDPKVPLVYKKFYDLLRAGGINPVRTGGKVRLMAMTNKDLDVLAGGREIKSADTVDWKAGLKPVPGGLFDPALTGGHGGTRWASIRLPEPMPNPVMEDPVRNVLGLTEQKFEDVLAGRAELGGRRGPGAVAHALDRIDLPRAIAAARAEVAGGKKTARDKAVKRLAYLVHAERLGLHPRDWVLDRVPVLPPAFRPVSVMSGNGRPMVADANYLYKEVIDAADNLREMAGRVDDVGEERLALYRAFKAVTGLGDPVQPKNQERQVKGVLKAVFGSSPKFGIVQRKLLGSTVDLVGRAVITPNPDLDMDQVGIPETKAWEIYRPFVVRRLARRGVPAVVAAQLARDQAPAARRALLEEMDDRPVIVTRAPVLHRYGVMAFFPRLVKGETLQVPPTVVKGFAADFDGDAMNYHVPASDEAVRDAVEKMLPSRNLLSAATFGVHYLPQNEYVGGLYESTRPADEGKPERVFQTRADALRALARGDIGPRTRIAVLQP